MNQNKKLLLGGLGLLFAAAFLVFILKSETKIAEREENLEPAEVEELVKKFNDTEKLEPREIAVPDQEPPPQISDQKLTTEELRTWLYSFKVAYAKKDREEMSRILDYLLKEHRGAGDQVLALVLSDSLDRIENGGGLIFLQVALSLARHGNPEGIGAFQENIEILMSRLIHQAFSPEGSAPKNLLSILALPGVLQGKDLHLLLSLHETIRSKGNSPIGSFLQSLLSGIEKIDPDLVEYLLTASDFQIRKAAYEALLKMDRKNIYRLTETFPHLQPREAESLLKIVFEHAALEDISQFLNQIEKTEPPGTNYSLPLLAYLPRTNLENYKKDVLYQRGHSKESENFRSNAVAAANLFLTTSKGKKQNGLEFFISLFNDDPSPQVRHTALLAIANHWDPSDPEGFQTILDQAASNPETAVFVQSAQAVFRKELSEDTKAAHEELKQKMKNGGF